MDLALLIANLVLDAATLAVLGVYIYIAILTNRQVATSQKQVQAAQASLELAQRPFAYPSGDLQLTTTATATSSINFGDDSTVQAMTLVNAGAGIALNIHGILMPPLPNTEMERKLRAYARRVILRVPLRPGDEAKEQSTTTNPPFSWTTTLTADPDSTFAAPIRTSGIDLPVLARLTLTFEDALGHTHGCQYDYVETGVAQGRWEFFRFYPYPEVREDIPALTRRLEVEVQTALRARPMLADAVYGPGHVE